MILLVDENITHAREIFGELAAIHSFRGRELTRRDLEGVSILLVRSVTRVDASLLEGSSIRFVGSATIGTDHIDLGYLKRAGVGFAHAPGSNADSVVEFVIASLLRLCVRTRRVLRGKRVGIVGCGHIGGRLARQLPHFGVDVLLNDPPLAAQCEKAGRAHDFLPLEEVLSLSDVVTLHVPLERQGPFPTVHLIGIDALRSMKKGSWLINTSRGPVVDNEALKLALSSGTAPSRVVLDVWEGEPEPDAELVGLVELATPHIAGYAYDAKLRGTWMLYREVCRFLGEEDPGEMPVGLGALPHTVAKGAPDPTLSDVEWLDLLVQGMYDVAVDDEALRRIVDEGTIDGSGFATLRSNYRVRREFSAHSLPKSSIPADVMAAVERGLGIALR